MYNLNGNHFQSLHFTPGFKNKIKEYTIYPASGPSDKIKPYASAARVREVTFENLSTQRRPISHTAYETHSILRRSTPQKSKHRTDTFDATPPSQTLADLSHENYEARLLLSDANLAFPYTRTGNLATDFKQFQASVRKGEIEPWLSKINEVFHSPSTNAYLDPNILLDKVLEINQIKADPKYAPDKFEEHVMKVWNLSPGEYDPTYLMYTKPSSPPSASASGDPLFSNYDAPPEAPPLQQQQKGMTKESIIAAMLFGALISIVFFMLMGRNWLLFFLPLTLVFLAISAMQVQYAPAASLEPGTPERSDAVIVVSRIIAAVWALEFIFMVDVYYPKPSLGWTFAMGITIFLAIFMNIGGILWLQQRLAPETSSY